MSIKYRSENMGYASTKVCKVSQVHDHVMKYKLIKTQENTMMIPSFGDNCLEVPMAWTREASFRVI
jgi:hypothetical protein